MGYVGKFRKAGEGENRSKGGEDGGHRRVIKKVAVLNQTRDYIINIFGCPRLACRYGQR